MKKIIAALALVAATSTAHAGTVITFPGSAEANEAYDCYSFGVTEECEYVGGTNRSDADKYLSDVRETLNDIAALGYAGVSLSGSTLVVEAAFKGQVYNTDLFAKLFAVRNVYVNNVVYKFGERIVKNDEAKVFGRSKGFVRFQTLEIYSAGRLSATQKVGG